MQSPQLAEIIPLREIHTMRQGRDLIIEWQRHAARFEALYELAAIQRDMSEALRADCEREIASLRELLK